MHKREGITVPTWSIVLLIVLVVLIGVLVALYFIGKRLEKRQAEQEAQIQAAKQTTSMLIIDKKRLPLNQSGLPQMVIDQAPKLMRRSKVPVVKAKVGPKITTMVADEKIFDLIPVKKEVKAEVSGIYIVGIRGIHGKLPTPEEKLTRWQKFRKKIFQKASSSGR